MSSKNEKYRDRVHCLLLYPDDESHVVAMMKIKKNYDYAYILHDKDESENGETKKPHWHVVLRFNQARWSSAICKELNIQENYIEKARNFNSALLYLIHFNDSDKYQYDINDVHGTLKNRITQEIGKVNKSEGEIINELLDFIECSVVPIRYMDFCRYCAENGYWSYFRRSGAIFSNILSEHNMECRMRSDVEYREGLHGDVAGNF